MDDLDDSGSIFEGGDDIITTWLRSSRAPKQAYPSPRLQSRVPRPLRALLVKAGRAPSPGTLAGTESLPTLTTTTTCVSSRNSILDGASAVRPEPITIAERLALNRLTKDSISVPDVERILNDLEPLNLDDLLVSMDKVVDEFPTLAPHMEKRAVEVPAFRPQDQVANPNPKVLPWLASVNEPEGSRSVSDSPEPHFSSHADEFVGTGHPEQADGHPKQTDGHPEQVESHPEQADSHSERVEGQPERRDSHLEQADNHPEQTDSHPEQADTQQDQLTEVTQDLGHLQLTEFGKLDPQTCCSTSEPNGIDSQNSFLSTTDSLDEDNVADIGSYAVERLFGPAIEDTLHWSQVQGAVENFIDELVALKLGTEGTGPQEDGSFGSSSGLPSLKRKASAGGSSRSRRPRKDGDDGDDEDDEDTSRRNGGGEGPPGNGKPSDSGKSRPLEFMCPYRLKDPIRFNVREWYDCATKVYICEEMGSKRNELNELRRHIKQRHSGPGILSQPYCSACKQQFPSPTLLDEHARRRACSYRELPSSTDPLDGLSPEAERALRSKQGRQGDTAISQYRQICQIALGNASEIPSPGYLPVIEHFELHGWHIKCLPQLRGAFLRKLPFQLGSIVESLLETIQIHTVDVLGQCNSSALSTAGSYKRRKSGARKTADTRHVPDREDAATAMIQPSRAAEQMRVASGIAMRRESNASGDMPIPEQPMPRPGWLSTDYFPSIDTLPPLSLSVTTSSDIQQSALRPETPALPVIDNSATYSRLPESGPPSLASNTDFHFFTPACSKMAATPNLWPGEDTDASSRIEDALVNFDVLLAANGTSEYSVPGVGKELVGPPPVMFELGYEERLMPLEHVDHQGASEQNNPQM